MNMLKFDFISLAEQGGSTRFPWLAQSTDFEAQDACRKIGRRVALTVSFPQTSAVGIVSKRAEHE